MKAKICTILVILAIAISVCFSLEAIAGAQGGGSAPSGASTISGKPLGFMPIQIFLTLSLPTHFCTATGKQCRSCLGTMDTRMISTIGVK